MEFISALPALSAPALPLKPIHSLSPGRGGSAKKASWAGRMSPEILQRSFLAGDTGMWGWDNKEIPELPCQGQIKEWDIYSNFSSCCCFGGIMESRLQKGFCLQSPEKFKFSKSTKVVLVNEIYLNLFIFNTQNWTLGSGTTGISASTSHWNGNVLSVKHPSPSARAGVTSRHGRAGQRRMGSPCQGHCVRHSCHIHSCDPWEPPTCPEKTQDTQAAPPACTAPDFAGSGGKKIIKKN